MTMIMCPNCTQQTDADLNFCEQCFEQTKCVKCRSTLKKGAPRCLHCGERVVGGDDSDPIRQNTVLVEEKQQQEGDNYTSFRRLSVSLNDKAVPALGGLLAAGVSGLGGSVQVTSKQAKRTSQGLPKPGESIFDYVAETARDEEVGQGQDSADTDALAKVGAALPPPTRPGLDIGLAVVMERRTGI